MCGRRVALPFFASRSLISDIPCKFLPAFNHPQKNNRRKLAPPPANLDPNSSSGALFHLGRLRSFGSLNDLKFDRVTLLQCPVAIPGYRRVVYEYIRPIFPANESVSFRIIEPLYCSLHFVSPLDGDSGGGNCKAPPRARIARSVSKWNHESRPHYRFYWQPVHIYTNLNRLNSLSRPSLPQKSKVIQDACNRFCVLQPPLFHHFCKFFNLVRPDLNFLILFRLRLSRLEPLR